MKKHPVIGVLVAIVILLFIAALMIPLFIDANAYRPTLEAQLSSALSRKVTLGKLSFSAITGSLVADDVVIADNPAFSNKPFLQARSLRVGVEVAPLLFHHQLRVTSLVANAPAINLVHNAKGEWNFADLGSHMGSRAPNSQSANALPTLTVGRIKVVNGSATVSDVLFSGPPFTYSKLFLSSNHFSLDQSFPFVLSAVLPAGGRLDVKGNAGPVNQKDASQTPLHADLSLKHFDPVAAGVVPASEGISMLADITAQVTSDGNNFASSGTVHAAQLKLVASGASTPNPVDIAYNVDHNLQARSGRLSGLDIKTGGVTVHVNGTYAMSGPQLNLALQLAAPNLPINQIEALLPAAGVRLPSGSSLQGGTLTANLAISGPANAPTVRGPVQIDNSRLAGFDLSSSIGGLKPAGRSQGGTQIQTLRANVNSSAQGIRVDSLYAVIPPLGTATGAGTVAPAGGLNFDLMAKLNTSLVHVGGGFLGQVLSAAAEGIPVHITGTTTNPIIQADLSKVLQKNSGNLVRQLLGNGNNKSNPGDVLRGLFHH